MEASSLEITRDEKIGYRLIAQQWFDLPVAEIFPFFSDAMQLETITPPLLHFSVETPQPITISQGAVLDYRLRLRGIPIRWRSEICVWDPPRRFVDQQLRGPYKKWYHDHVFEEIDGRTLVTDNVHYIPRGGWLIHRFFVKPDLERIFRFRQNKLREIFIQHAKGRTSVAGGQTATMSTSTV